ncbi:flavodoxin domain-containing protein [Oceanobacter antarcticus]|uniref:Flavodoxin domain-containing protein n=1 Tax=Oceanobacter antarcticus TaxID=3133425 RepID=A0ABW8NDF7_9GAMM|tara:strand:- start:956 stop:1414 length:459 start_codon:yes stop_codon:yes gene_type:complete
MAKIQVIIGSVNGTALQVGAVVAQLLEKLGHHAWINVEPSAADLGRDADEILLICCSTTGNGELPRNIYPVYLALEDQLVNLQGRRYAVIALGDSGYPRYAQAGMTLEALLYGSGASQVSDLYRLDAALIPNAEQPMAAARWALQWSDLLSA